MFVFIVAKMIDELDSLFDAETKRIEGHRECGKWFWMRNVGYTSYIAAAAAAAVPLCFEKFGNLHCDFYQRNGGDDRKTLYWFCCI